MRLDEKTLVPMSWVVISFGIGITPVAAAVFWISSVNYRLQRIEERLGIPSYQSPVTTVDGVGDAHASEK